VRRYDTPRRPRARLAAIDLPNPSARDDHTVPQAGRTSTTEHAQYLAEQVDRVLAASGASQVVLVGNSRGGYAIRNYLKNHGGAAKVSHAVLGGTPNHGVWAIPAFRPNNEFNGAGPFLIGLNAPAANGDEVTPGVKWLTLRSDDNDKFAQPDGVWIGAKGTATNVSFDGPALKGATNIVLPARDHREVSFHEQAFAPTYEFITGRKPATLDIVAEAKPVLNGKISGIGPGGPDNKPLAGATLEVFAVDAASGARRGAALHRKVVGADGLWGPFQADNGSAYEFVLSAPGYATTHIYRSPFARSSDLVHLRAQRLADADKDAASVVTLSRPRGYFGVPRDRISFDGISPAPGLPSGVAGVSSSKLKLASGAGRAVVAEFESGSIRERIVGVAWPATENRVVLIELTQ
jgi:pimeloyl-ACP methyl ester carboxylesterase